jgi:hypothetical protein
VLSAIILLIGVSILIYATIVDPLLSSYTFRTPYAERKKYCVDMYDELYRRQYKKTNNYIVFNNDNTLKNEEQINPMVLYKSKGTVRQQLVFLTSLKDRETGEWTKLIPLNKYKFPLIFPICYFPSDIGVLEMGKSMICYSDRSKEYGWNPTINGLSDNSLHLVKDQQWQGEIQINFNEQDIRFEFSKHYSSIKILIP